jgi:carbohydrate kinase (thermoresistant glucokinase family)
MNKIIIIAGIPGAGKSTVGKILRDKLGFFVYDVDDHIPEPVRQKMRDGLMATDEDRDNYLNEAIRVIKQNNTDTILITPLFKQRHVDILRKGLPDAMFIFLEAPVEVLFERVKSRDHFFSEDLLREMLTQNEDLEVPYIPINAEQAVEKVVDDIEKKIIT